MVRISKQQERRMQCPKRCRAPASKTGSKKDNLPLGYRLHANALNGVIAETSFIPKLSSR